MLDPELVEDPDDDAADVVPRAVGRRQRAEQQIERALVVALVQRGEGLLEVRRAASRRASAIRAARPSAAKLPGTRAAAPAPRRRLRERAGSGPAARPRRRGRLELDRPAQRLLVAASDELVGLGGQQRVEEALDRRRRLRADELGDHLPSRNALTAGMLWIRKVRAMPGLASTSILASSTLPSRAATARSITGPSWRQGPHHSAQKSTTTGTCLERSRTAV